MNKKIKFPSNGDYRKLFEKLSEAQRSIPFKTVELDCREIKSTIYLRSAKEVNVYINALLMCWTVRPKEQ